MKKGILYPTSRIETEVEKDGQSLEEFLRKARYGKEPIQASAKITYNDRKDGVLPQHDIRTDRFEVALLATDKIHATAAAKRQEMDFPKNEKGKVEIPYTGGEA